MKDEVRLNLRTGPGNQFRILGSVETGDSVEILERGDGWIQVRADGKQGWVPEGFLQERAARRGEARAHRDARRPSCARAAESLDDDADEAAQTRTRSSRARESEQRAELERLTRDNMELRAGARWPEWIAGACILAVGMGAGRAAARQRPPPDPAHPPLGPA